MMIILLSCGATVVHVTVRVMGHNSQKFQFLSLTQLLRLFLLLLLLLLLQDLPFLSIQCLTHAESCCCCFWCSNTSCLIATYFNLLISLPHSFPSMIFFVFMSDCQNFWYILLLSSLRILFAGTSQNLLVLFGWSCFSGCPSCVCIRKE